MGRLGYLEWHSVNTVQPCAWPTCRDGNGDKRLTSKIICDGCRQFYRRHFGWLVEDYAYLHAYIGQLKSQVSEDRVATSKSYGHPAEALSDMKAEISKVAFSWEDAIRDHLGHTEAVSDGKREQRLLTDAVKYLRGQEETLFTFDPAAQAAEEIHKLHRDARRILGMTGPVQHLPLPCPECDLLTMYRMVGLDRSDRIYCGNCGIEVGSDHYGVLVRARAYIASLDTPEVQVS